MVLLSTVEFDERKTQGNLNIKETQDFHKDKRKQKRKKSAGLNDLAYARLQDPLVPELYFPKDFVFTKLWVI